MPTSLKTIFLQVPPAQLERLLDRCAVPLPPDFTWASPPPKRADTLELAVNSLEPDARQRFLHEVDRIKGLTGDAGDSALYGVADPELLDEQPSSWARSMAVYLADEALFRRAEEVRYTDNRRFGRYWEGFVGQPGLDLLREGSAIAALEHDLKQHFGCRNILIEIFDRSRPSVGGETDSLIQVTVYREGRLNELPAFVDGELGVISHRPVLEAALTYQPKTGAIEVVADSKETRGDVVRFCCSRLLRTEFGQQPLPPRRFDLRVLLKPFDFPTRPEDQIQEVRVNSLRLAPLDTEAERLTFECLRRASHTIWDMAATRLDGANPFESGWRIVQACLTIVFRPEKGYGRGRTLPVKITLPHGCDLNDRTERERLVTQKYFREWGILTDG